LMVQVIQSTGHAHKPINKEDRVGPGELYEAAYGSFLHLVWRGEGDKGEIVTDLDILMQKAGEEGSKTATLPGQAHGVIPLGGAMVFSDLVSTETDHKELSASRLGGAPVSMAIDPVDGKMYIVTNPRYSYVTYDVHIAKARPGGTAVSLSWPGGTPSGTYCL